jgi:oligoendopeptidase F
MKALLVTVMAVVLGAAPITYQIDLVRYFPGGDAEALSRSTAIASAKAFAASATPRTAAALLLWLQKYDSFLTDLERHDIYLYLKAEENDQDRRRQSR